MGIVPWLNLQASHVSNASLFVEQRINSLLLPVPQTLACGHLPYKRILIVS